MLINEEGYKLGGSVTYAVFVHEGDVWKLFDTISGDNEPEAIKNYSDVISNKKQAETVVIEYNAPNNIPKELNSLNNLNIVFSNVSEREVYDESWLRLNGLKNNEYDNKMSYTVHETKKVLEDLFKFEPNKIIKETNYNDDFINITMLIQRNPLVESSNILIDYAEKKYENTMAAEEIAEIIENKTGMDLYDFTKLIREDNSKHFSKSAHDWVDKQVEKLYPKHVKDKEEAFGIAWKQYKSHNK